MLTTELKKMSDEHVVINGAGLPILMGVPTPAALAQQAQAMLENDIWEYRNKKTPQIAAKIERKICQFTARQLISREDACCDRSSNRSKCLGRLAAAGDFVILTTLQYRANNYVSKSRAHGFSFTFHHNVVIVYYPATETVDYNTYVSY